MSEADALVAALGLARHPEGGWYRETFRDAPDGAGRSRGTAILFLLKHGEASHWHRIDAAEIWHFYRGAPLALRLATAGEAATHRVLGPNIERGESPQIVVPRGAWQAARTLGDYTLVGCTVAPGFEFAAFELAPPDFAPGG